MTIELLTLIALWCQPVAGRDSVQLVNKCRREIIKCVATATPESCLKDNADKR